LTQRTIDCEQLLVNQKITQEEVDRLKGDLEEKALIEKTIQRLEGENLVLKKNVEDLKTQMEQLKRLKEAENEKIALELAKSKEELVFSKGSMGFQI